MAIDDGWMKYAACRRISDPDRFFFPQKHKGIPTDYTRAKEICDGCPVELSCLAYSIAHNIPEGVWGGLSDLERKRLPREYRQKLRKAWWKHHPYARQSRPAM